MQLIWLLTRKVVIAFSLASLALCAGDHLWSADQTAQAEAHANKGLELAQAGKLDAAEAELRQALALAPSDPGYLSNLGTVLAMEKKLEQSTIFFEQALRIDPAGLTTRRYLAANLWQLHRFPEAKRNLQIILKQAPNDKPTLLLLGMVAENMKDYPAAASALGAVPELVRQRPESVLALARSYYKTGKTDQARATLDELTNDSFGSQPVFLGAQIADQGQDYLTAEKLLVSIQSAFPDQITLGYTLALVRFHAKQLDESKQTLLDLITSGRRNSRIYNLLGWVYHEQRQPKEATDALQEAINLDSAQEANYLDLGKILLADRSLLAALDIAKRTTAAFPKSAEAWSLRGSVELKVGQFTDAVQSYSHAVRLAPADAGSRLGLGEAQFAADRILEATDTFETGMRRFPKDARFPLQYALVFLKKAETGDSGAEGHAEQLLNSALAIDDSLAEGHYQLGKLALNRDRENEAVEHLERAVRIDPRNMQAHFALSTAYRRLGRKQEAMAEMSAYETLKRQEGGNEPPQEVGVRRD